MTGKVTVTCHCGQTVEHEQWCKAVPRLVIHDPDDPIGIERAEGDWVVIAYLAFAAIVIFCLGLLFGAYVL